MPVTQIELSSSTLSIQTLYRMFRDGEFYVDRRYQRKLVWTLEEKQKLIDSVLKEFPVPLVLFSRRSGTGGSVDIIDGLQRLHTILSFIENAFRTSEGRLFDMRQLPRAAQAAADDGRELEVEPSQLLTAAECAAFSEYTLPVTVVERADGQSIIEIFERDQLLRSSTERAGAAAGWAILRIVVPGQSKISFLNDNCYARQGSSTVKLPVQSIPDIARRFQ